MPFLYSNSIAKNDSTIKNRNIPAQARTSVQEKAITNPCSNTVITFETNTKAACKEKPDGSISLQNISGGEKPYKIYVNGNLHGQNPFINHLEANTYQIQVQDKNACESSSKPVRIQDKVCDINAVIKLSANEKWIADANMGDKIIITDKIDKIVYQNNQTNVYEHFEWHGTDTQGNELSPGIYFIYIYLKDNLIQKGSITISY